MKGHYYKVLFYDKLNKVYYLLGFTSNKKVNQSYYIGQGYKKKDLIYIKIQK